jgi:hypothetical protein
VIIGPYGPWHGGVWRGTWHRPGQDDRVFLLVGPDAAGRAVDRARHLAERALKLSGAGVLPLLEVTTADGRVAWVHPEVPGLGLGHVVGPEASSFALPIRAAAQVVAEVAATLERLGDEGTWHKGPEPMDLLVERTGKIWVAGFAGPFPRSVALRASEGGASEPALVYRLGVLLAHLVAGMPPGPALQRPAHVAQVRRILVRAMARPGPVLPEALSDWIRTMLAWEPTARPRLAAVPAGLRKVAATMDGEDLPTWAAARVEVLCQRLAARRSEVGAPPRRVDTPAPPAAHVAHDPTAPGESTSWFADPNDDAPTQMHQEVAPLPIPATRTAEADSAPPTRTTPLGDDDDPTMEEKLPDTPPPAPSAGPMPVAVGPAPAGRAPSPPKPQPASPPAPRLRDPAIEAIRPDSTPQLRDRATAPPPTEPVQEVVEEEEEERAGRMGVYIAVWVAACAVLAVIALGVAAVIVASEASQPRETEAAQLAEVIPPPVAPAPRAPAAEPRDTGGDGATGSIGAEPAAAAVAPEPAAPVTPDPAAPEPPAAQAEAAPPTPRPEPPPPAEVQARAPTPVAPQPPQPPQPTPPEPAPVTPGAPLTLVVRYDDGSVPLKVNCNGVVASGFGEVRVVGAPVGPCKVEAGSYEAGGIRKTVVTVKSSTTLSCTAGAGLLLSCGA